MLLPTYTISGGIVLTPLTNYLRVRSTPGQGRHPTLDPQDLPAVRLLAWADVVGDGGRPRRWRGLEIHVDQYRGKNSRRTSVRRLTEGNPERPATPLAWEPPWPGGSLRPFGANSQLRDCICDNFGNVMKNQAIDWRLQQQLSHEDISELLESALLLTYWLFRQMCSSQNSSEIWITCLDLGFG